MLNLVYSFQPLEIKKKQVVYEQSFRPNDLLLTSYPENRNFIDINKNVLIRQNKTLLENNNKPINKYAMKSPDIQSISYRNVDNVNIDNEKKTIAIINRMENKDLRKNIRIAPYTLQNRPVARKGTVTKTPTYVEPLPSDLVSEPSVIPADKTKKKQNNTQTIPKYLDENEDFYDETANILPDEFKYYQEDFFKGLTDQTIPYSEEITFINLFNDNLDNTLRYFKHFYYKEFLFIENANNYIYVRQLICSFDITGYFVNTSKYVVQPPVFRNFAEYNWIDGIFIRNNFLNYYDLYVNLCVRPNFAYDYIFTILRFLRTYDTNIDITDFKYEDLQLLYRLISIILANTLAFFILIMNEINGQTVENFDMLRKILEVVCRSCFRIHKNIKLQWDALCNEAKKNPPPSAPRPKQPFDWLTTKNEEIMKELRIGPVDANANAGVDAN